MVEIARVLTIASFGLAVLWTGSADAEPEADAPAPPFVSNRTEDAPFVFRLRAGAELGFRSFGDSERDARSARTYRAAPLPGIYAGIEFLPREDGVFAFDATVAQSIGIKSSTDDAAIGDVESTARTVTTSYLRIETAAKARWVLGSGPLPSFAGVFTGFSYSRFAFSDPPVNVEIPAATYDVLRLGLEGRATFGRLSLFASSEVDLLVAIAYLGDARPAPPGPGTTLHAGASFALTSWLAARVEGSYTVFAYSMVRDVAAVVTDQYGAGRLGLEARL
jgi:hypothetical protein